MGVQGPRKQKSAVPKAMNEVVSQQMSRMPVASSKPEVRLRRALHSLGLRFRLHRKDLPGSPDIVLPQAKMAIFVDGCFWHACPEHGTLPKNNREWWQQKLEATRARDGFKDSALEELGWLPVHVWEHEDPTQAALAIRGLWHKRTKVNGGK